MHRSGQTPEFDALDEPERYLHIHSKLKRIMAAAETQEQLVARLTRELAARDAAIAAKDAAIAAERAAREQAQAELAQYPTTAEDYMHPTLVVPESAILIPNNSFEIRTQFLIELKNNALILW